MSRNNKLGLIVEGQTELLAFRTIAAKRNIVIAPRFCGSISLSKVAEEIASFSRILSARCNHIIAIMDREQRCQTSEEIETEILSHVGGMSTGGSTLHVVCPDRMVENWMLADVDAWSSKNYIRSAVRQRNREGSDGVKTIKAMFNRGYSYQKTRHGVEMLELIRTSTAKRNSKSYARFIKAKSSTNK